MDAFYIMLISLQIIYLHVMHIYLLGYMCMYAQIEQHVHIETHTCMHMGFRIAYMYVHVYASMAISIDVFMINKAKINIKVCSGSSL